MSNSTSGFNGTECSDTRTFMNLAIMNIVAGGISVLVSLTLILCLIYLKKYHFHPQRLVMYLNITICFHGLTSVLQFHPLIVSNVSENTGYCKFIGVLGVYSEHLQLFIVTWIVVDMFVMSSFQFYARRAFEVLEVLTTLIVPLLYVWVPLPLDMYGPTGALCEITYVNIRECQEEQNGVILIVFLCFVPQFLALFLVIGFYIASHVNLHREKQKYTGIYDPQERPRIEELMKKLRVLQAYPFIYFAFELVVIVYIIVDINVVRNLHPYIQSIPIVALNIQGLALSLAYIFDSRTCTRIALSFRYKVAAIRSNRSDSIITYNASGMYVEFQESLVKKGSLHSYSKGLN